MGLKKTFNKQRAKRIAGKCTFCNEDDMKTLDVHRIIPGESGGTYCERNSVVVCANCHRKIHGGRIVIEGKYYSTSGRWKVFFTEDGVEKVI